MLDADAVFEVPHPLHVRIEGGDVGDAEPDRQLSGGRGIATHVDLAAWRQIDTSQFALRHAIATHLAGAGREAIDAGGVQIRPGHILRRQRERVVRVREASRALLHVLADAALERSALITKQVVDYAEPR